MGEIRRNHNHEIGEKTESDLLEIFSDMIENHWRRQIFDANGELKALDIHLFQIDGEDNSCGITVKSDPSDDQPGNGCVIFKNAQFDRHPLPFSWQELIIDPNVQCMDFVKKRFRFLNSDCTVKDIYHNRYAHDSPDRRTKFRLLAVNFLLTFEKARRVEPEGAYPVTQREVAEAQEIVFNPEYYKRENVIPYPEMVRWFAAVVIVIFVIVVFIHQVALAKIQRKAVLVSSQAATWPPAHLATTYCGGFTLPLFIADRQTARLWVLIFRLWVWPTEIESISNLIPLQLQPLNLLGYRTRWSSLNDKDYDNSIWQRI